MTIARCWMRALVAGAVLMTLTAPALAATGQVAWPTFFRAGPGRDRAVLEELQRGTLVDVQSCDGAWCAVRNGDVLGYVERSTLLDGALPGPMRPSGDCFDAKRSGYAGGELFRYCLKQGG